MKRKIDPFMISVMALLIALDIILWNILVIETQFLKVSFAFVPKLVIGTLFGPFWTGVGLVISDLVGNTIFARAPFFIGFTLNKFIEGLLYGYFFYRKNVTFKNTFLCTLTITIIINLGLTPIWLAIMYNVPINSWIIWGPRLVKAVLMIPVQTVLLYYVGRAIPLKRVRRKLKYSSIK